MKKKKIPSFTLDVYINLLAGLGLQHNSKNRKNFNRALFFHKVLNNFSSVSVTTVIPFDGDFKYITFQTLIKVMKFQVAAKLGQLELRYIVLDDKSQSRISSIKIRIKI